MSEARAILDAFTSEAQLQESIIERAQYYGYRVAHFRPARVRIRGEETYRTPVAADGEGFLDLVMVREPDPERGWEGRTIYAECKTETGSLSDKQREWIRVLSAAGEEVHVFRPSDWSSGRVDDVLR